MHKKAEHSIEICSKCNGAGTIIGPKQLELTVEDRVEWKKCDKISFKEFWWGIFTIPPSIISIFLCGVLTAVIVNNVSYL